MPGLTEEIINVVAFLCLLWCSQEDLPETVRQTKERMLKSFQRELTDKATEKKSKKVSKKYRMVKFFGMIMIICVEISKFPKIPQAFIILHLRGTQCV